MTRLSQNRSQLNDPGKYVLFAEIAIKFNDCEFVVLHPTKWKDAEDEPSSYDLYDPNHDHNDIDKTFKTTMKPYKDVMKKWVLVLERKSDL